MTLLLYDRTEAENDDYESFIIWIPSPSPFSWASTSNILIIVEKEWENFRVPYNGPVLRMGQSNNNLFMSADRETFHQSKIFLT